MPAKTYNIKLNGSKPTDFIEVMKQAFPKYVGRLVFYERGLSRFFNFPNAETEINIDRSSARAQMIGDNRALISGVGSYIEIETGYELKQQIP